ncbi:hydantoinase B/oxoprolinase family protein [Salinadaptatus halalkaliphilus]|uniref:Hydantoinase B/oxoprolinase family protein n=1 Tax=Salinadaptatus halalkaliphilus TaxID=2419781 RepID=A0A4S3TLT8_9EURY|nr:hydantoinase B/oxoprolinase family protein [Salinadaptatus halalkaliphilus]THE63965.1 hydantoinase B/oxoprolinase family protein [Salinadaptatus halalkaliphilus]
MRDTATNETDELETQVLWNRLQSTADEMYDAAERLAFSFSIREGADASTAVMTADGDAIGLSDQSVPVLSGALSRTTRIILEEHFPPEELEPGDTIITNDPWIGGGHLSDVVVLNPVFYDGELVGITGSLGHTDDVGGNRGGWSTDAEQVYEEGILIPPAKLYDAGERNDAIEAIIRDNVRIPHQTLGDIEALRSGNTLGEERLEEAIADYGPETFDHVADEVIDRSERALRDELEELPDDTHDASVTFEIAGFDITIAVSVTVDGSDLYVDFEGTSDQIDAGINCPFGNIVTVTEYIVKCMLVPELPNAEGFFRPIHVTAPEGSIINCDRPKATMGRHLTYSRAEDALIRALGQVVPESALSEMAGIQLAPFSGQDAAGNEFIAVGGTAGGFPPRAGKDGTPGVYFPYNGKSTPIEMFERYSPIRWVETALVPDSEGAGEYRSGPAVRSSYHNPTEQPAYFSLTSGRADREPDGFRGGESGKRATVESDADDKTVEPNGPGVLGPGETLSLVSATPGGYGDPTDRDDDRVETDVRLGYVSEERAREVYDYDPTG